MAIFSGSERLPRLALRLSMVAWLPYAALDLIDAPTGGGDARQAINHLGHLGHLGADLSVHARFLVAVPVPILAVLTLFILRVSLFTQSWSIDWLNSPQNPPRTRLAQLWLIWVSLPIYQYLLVDWALRVCAWSLMLWKFSRLHLRINPLHPDGKGGLAFLNSPQIAFAPLYFATAAVLAVDQRGYFLQASLLFEPTMEIALTILIPCLLLFLGPLLFFTPALFAKKDPLLLEDARFGGVLTTEFQNRWIEEQPRVAQIAGARRSSSRIPPQTALDRPDLSAFTVYITIFANATRMKIILIDKISLIPFLVATLIPLFALLLARLPLKEIFQLVAKTLM